MQGVDFKGRLDLEDATVAGHSMGAATAMRAGEQDTRFVRTLAFDPWLFPLGDQDVDVVRTPICILNSEHWNPSWRAGPGPGRNNERQERIVHARKAAGAAPVMYAEVCGTRHMSASDVQWVLDHIPRFMSGGAKTGKEMVDIFAVLAVTFMLGKDFASKLQELSAVMAAAEPRLSKDNIAMGSSASV